MLGFAFICSFVLDRAMLVKYKILVHLFMWCNLLLETAPAKAALTSFKGRLDKISSRVV